MSRFPNYDPFRIEFQRTDGVQRPEAPYDEPGTWHDDTHHDLLTGCFPAVTMILDYELTGADPSTGLWTVTVTPLTTQTGSAGADGLAPASISFTAAATALSDVVLGLIDAASEAAELLLPEDLAEWERFRSYVTLSVSPTAAEVLRFTSTASGNTFQVEITAPVGNGSTLTTIASPDDSVLTVGCYAAIDRTRGFNDQGQPFLKLVEASTPAADLVGPVWLGVGTEPLDPGDAYRVYSQANNVPLVRFGHVRAAGTKAIPNGSIDTPVYVLHTATGTFPSGAVTDAAGAAAGATANVWTMTPVVVNDTLYQMQIVFGSETVVLTYLSDAGALATEITAGMLAQLNLYNVAGGPLEGITGVDGATLVLTGPADGRSFVVTSIGVGDMGEAETTPGVTTHILHPRDEFIAVSPGIGSAPISVPHPTA